MTRDNTDSGPRGIPAHGSLELEPCSDIIAGEWGSWKLVYTAGSLGLASGGRLRITTDTDTDWGIPQVNDPSGAEYLSIQAPDGVVPSALAYRIADTRVTLTGRPLVEGERVVITIGDRTGGGPGSRAQTTYERRHYFDLLVDVAGDGSWVKLDDRPCVRIRGADGVALDVVAPSMVAVGEPFRLLVRVRDRWGNPASTYFGAVRLSLPQGSLPSQETRFLKGTDAVAVLEGCTLVEQGIFRVKAEDADGALVADSNPILCCPPAAEHRLYWGEPHGGQLHMETKIDEFFRYARDVSGLDFCGYQANDERLTLAEYAVQQQAEASNYAPGRFVPLPGFEWSATTRFGGHHNVYFRRFGQPIRRAAHGPRIAGEGDEDTDLNTAEALHDAYRGTDTVITPHVGGGRADLSRHDASCERAIEVASTHGTFEWFLRDALERRLEVGFVGGSDGYTGRPGLEFPGFVERRFSQGGYTALYAQELTLEALFDALRRRHAYATSGARILISFETDGHSMGDKLATRALPHLTGLVAGTAPLEAIEIYRGLDVIHCVDLESRPSRGLLRVLWEGAAHKDSYSAAICDGQLALADDGQGDAFCMAGPPQGLRFDSPRCWVRQVSGTELMWHGITSGYRSGFTVPLTLPDGELKMDVALQSSLGAMKAFGGFGDAAPNRMSYTPMETVRRRVDLAELDRGPVVLDLGPLDRRVTLSWAPQPQVAERRFEFTDVSPEPGTNAYWLRVIQQDQEMAWTSPIFVDWAP